VAVKHERKGAIEGILGVDRGMTLMFFFDCLTLEAGTVRLS
jgi:hypothetical protein